MTSIHDFAPWHYSGQRGDHLLAVGWLSNAGSFPTGATAREVYTRLQEFAKDPWQPFRFMGVHECELCQFHGEQCGSANLFIPHDGKIYVAPMLILHYINAHHYAPPKEFCDAVLACPPMRSMEYKKVLIACGGSVLWKMSDDVEIL